MLQLVYIQDTVLLLLASRMIDKESDKGAVTMVVKIMMMILMIVMAFNSIAVASQASMYQRAGQFEGTIGVYAKNLNTGKTITINDATIFPTASTSKLVVAMAVYKYLYPSADVELRDRYDEDIELMMRVSDNDSFYELLEMIDEENPTILSRVVSDLDLKNTQIHSKDAYQVYEYSSVTTPQEMAQVFEEIYRGGYLESKSTTQLKDWLANSVFHDELPRYLPGSVMHKIGQLDDVLCDVGVVDDGQNQILISIFTRTEWDEEYASDAIAELAASVYKELVGSENT